MDYNEIDILYGHLYRHYFYSKLIEEKLKIPGIKGKTKGVATDLYGHLCRQLYGL